MSWYSSGDQLCPRALIVVLSLFAVVDAAPATAQTPAVAVAEPDSADGPLRPGDVVRVKVWREPDLSGEFTVNETGQVVIPKLGPLSVADHSTAALKDSMLAGYAAYLRNPSVDITFLRRIAIGGAVRNPGLYTVDPTVSVTDALALAGGVSGAGKTNLVELVRGADRISIRIDRAQPLNDVALRSGDQLVVPQRSWVSRNPWIIAAAISTTAGFLRLAIR